MQLFRRGVDPAHDKNRDQADQCRAADHASGCALPERCKRNGRGKTGDGNDKPQGLTDPSFLKRAFQAGTFHILKMLGIVFSHGHNTCGPARNNGVITS